ncbi:MAG: hypothetical protein F6K54_03495 [Okeania sp. SIO3B5]|uniref:alpha/beta hydrolase n=1 Tax=Okeania sp. SIO3B5 TaxID=2607811 RepID=UPI001400DE84|nr:alpha/beta hydrolase [Okeania sp. SIO3B5]NEO52227.1 hypothetical protein [Okeania sp. SIO3B5]
MANNLLIVFGGTTESDVVFPVIDTQDKSLKSSGLFTQDELDLVKVDVLQFNLLTSEPNINFFANKNSYFDNSCQRLTNKSNSWFKRDLIMTKKEFDFQDKTVLEKLDDLLKTIEDINWSSLNYSENSDGRGMTVEAFNNFSEMSRELIVSFLEYLENKKNNYDKVFMLAHSRGCALALQLLSDRSVNTQDDTQLIQLADNLLTKKLKRIVLLDPVSKNATNTFSWSTDANNVVSPANAKIVKLLSTIKDENKEIHIISKAKSAKIINYESYADRLVGTKQANKNNSSDSPNMSNVYVDIADMVHEGMLSGDLYKKGNFTEYTKIISDSPWNTTYVGDQDVDLEEMKKSKALKEYIEGNKSANELTPGDGDPLKDFYEKIEQKDRRRAFVHCLARKVQLLS